MSIFKNNHNKIRLALEKNLVKQINQHFIGKAIVSVLNATGQPTKKNKKHEWHKRVRGSKKHFNLNTLENNYFKMINIVR